MKQLKLLLSLICIVAVLLALAVSAGAIGFKAEEKYNSVFVVTSGNSLGSGFAVGENCIVTNAHVIRNPDNIVLTTYSGDNHDAYLVGYDEDKDIAVLSVGDVKFTPLVVVDYNTLNTGDDVYAIGAPKSMAYTLTKGVISAKEREIGKYKYIQTDAAINEGNSGGPLLNDEGNVIGINTLKMSDSEGIGLAIPMTSVCEFLKSLEIELDENGNVSKTIASAPDKEPEQTPAENEDGTQIVYKTSSERESVLFVLLCVSVVVNFMLAVMLRLQRKKKPEVPYDPRERTDFEIDILE